MNSGTSELFELNKIWVVWGISLLILFFWSAKMILTRKIAIQRTPLDIPILLFLASQFLSTIFSIDSYVSFWGYYSRFNGGFLSILSYIFLYYAFASNVLNAARTHTYKILLFTFVAGVVVAIWGFPSHFGYDPTCLMFRGSLDVACWTDAFQPKVRIFSTLGQPNWLATYLAALLPIGFGFGLESVFKYREDKKSIKSLYTAIVLFVAVTLFYIDIIWTDSQSGFIGLWAGLVVMAGIFGARYVLKAEKKNRRIINGVFAGGLVVFLLLNLLLGMPIERLKNFSFSQITKQTTSQAAQQDTQAAPLPALEFGGTDSSKIRLIVWRGALDIFKTHPILGSGVETFAYAYYQHRPAAHNLTSEWDYLYNKAHNEYLNYLATTGILGLGTYLFFIGYFFVLVFKSLKEDKQSWYVPAGIVAGFVSILVSQFFGFSVVISNLLLFMMPLWFLHLVYPKFVVSEKVHEDRINHTPLGNILIVAIGIFLFSLEFVLLRYWLADKAYALGNNLDKVGEYTQANSQLVTAVQMRPHEDLFRDELSVNLGTLAFLFAQQNQATQAAQLGQQAKDLSDMVVAAHPNNVVYWKSRTRVMYSLAQIQPDFFQLAIQAIEQAHKLAPTDAKIMYNMALMYSQAGNPEKAIEVLKRTTALKPNYRDAYYMRAFLLSEMAKTESATNSAKAQTDKTEAKNDIEFILKYLSPEDKEAKSLLEKLK